MIARFPPHVWFRIVGMFFNILLLRTPGYKATGMAEWDLPFFQYEQPLWKQVGVDTCIFGDASILTQNRELIP